jgi:hypothetical protein
MEVPMPSPRDQGHQDRASKRGTTWVILFRAILFGAISLNVVGCAASAYRWTELPQTNFPSKVNQIITEHGNLLDRRHRAGYGEWNVSALSEPAMATYACLPQETCHIAVNRLRCTNAHLEKTECVIRLDVEKKVCRLLLPEKKHALAIRCPLDVVLARVKSEPVSEARTDTPKHTASARF